MIPFKPGDKVRLKKVSDRWIVQEETVMTILEMVEMPDGKPGARCEWNGHGSTRPFESVFPLSALLRL
jgi:hypothetical protein